MKTFSTSFTNDFTTKTNEQMEKFADDIKNTVYQMEEIVEPTDSKCFDNVDTDIQGSINKVVKEIAKCVENKQKDATNVINEVVEWMKEKLKIPSEKQKELNDCGQDFLSLSCIRIITKDVINQSNEIDEMVNKKEDELLSAIADVFAQTVLECSLDTSEESINLFMNHQEKIAECIINEVS